MMSADKHIMDLGLSLGYPENCTGNAGAGVNAASSSMNMIYPVSDSLSELVWSPHSGLTVKHTPYAFSDKRPLLLWNVGPSNGDPSSSQGIRCKENDDDDGKIVADSTGGIEQKVMVLSRTEDETEVCDLAKQEMDYAPESTTHDAGLVVANLSFQSFRETYMSLNREISSDPNHTVNKAFISDLIQEEGRVAATAEAHIIPLQKSRYLDTEEAKDANEEDSGENDPGLVPGKSARKQQNEERVIRCSSVPLGSHSHQLKKDKARAFSEGNVNKRKFLDNEDDDSQESVESCHSACMLGKRTWNSTHQLMVENKRMKTGVDENIASTSMIQRDNSFMIWISNMVKGFSEVNHDEGPSLDLTLARSNHEDMCLVQEKSVLSEWQDPVSRNTGFQTVFQSLYYPCTNFLEAGTSEIDISAEELQMEIDKLDREEDIARQSDNSLSTYSPVEDDFKADTAENTELRDQEGLMYKNGCSSSASLANHGATGELSNKEKVFGGEMWLTRLTAKVCGSPLNMVMSKRDDCLAPFLQTWKGPDFADGEKCPERATDTGDPSLDMVMSKRDDCLAPYLQAQKRPDFADGQKCPERANDTTNVCGTSPDMVMSKRDDCLAPYFQTWKSPDFADEEKCPERATDTAKVCGTSLDMVTSKRDDCLAPYLQAWKSPDFADGEKCPEGANDTINVCGTSPDMVMSKRDDCLAPYFQTRKSPDFADGEKCQERANDAAKVCCTSLDMVMSKRDNCLKPYLQTRERANDTSGSIAGSAKEIDPFASNAESSLGSKNIHGYGYQSGESSHKSRTSEAMASTFARRLDAFKHIVPAGLQAETETEIDQLVEVTGKKQKSTSVMKESALEEEINLNRISSTKMTIPSGVFDTVRRLQVSRADMQRWNESSLSLSQLEGLFLRLRLGKWEEGLGGTGYYVARITENSEPSEDCRKSISVNIGGMKCSVGSQYISNTCFLEDELVVWWLRTLNTGGSVPSKEELDANLRRIMALGL